MARCGILSRMKQADILWQQGQPFSPVFNDVYYSREGGLTESEYVFLQQNDLPERWQGARQFVIAETGFGSGLNFLCTVRQWLAQADTQACLHYLSIEKFPLSKADLEQVLGCWPELAPLAAELIANYPPAVKGFHPIHLFEHRVQLTLIFDSVEAALPDMHACVDAWYLDGFAPDKNPEMWTDTVFRQMARLGKPGTTFSSFTAASHVRRGLQAAGFEVEKVKGFGKKRDMLRGRLEEAGGDNSIPPWFALPTPQEKINRKKHAVVIGAGIAGMSTAWSLAKRGWQVDILERDAAIAGGGSGNPQGLVMPRINLGDGAERAFYDAAFLKTVRELNALKQGYPELDWQQGGVLQLAHSPRIRQQIEKLHTAEISPGLVQTLTAEQASKIAGIQITHAALYFPQAGWLDPVQLCQLLLKDAGPAVHVHLNSHVDALHYRNRTWQLEDQTQSVITTADTVILANASAVGQFSQTACLPLLPARGQVSLIAANTQSKNLRCAICHEGYLLPANQGAHIIGASFLAGDASTEARAAEDADNLRQLHTHLPGLFDNNETILASRAALRATTSDHLPLLGPVMDTAFFAMHYADVNKGKPPRHYPAAEYLEGLYVNIGHGARGLTSALLAAELISCLLNQAPLPVAESTWQAINPARFLIRALKTAP